MVFFSMLVENVILFMIFYVNNRLEKFLSATQLITDNKYVGN